jgi:hypothetical protein
MKLRFTREQIAGVLALAIVAAIAVFSQGDQPPKFDTFLSTDYASGGVRGWSLLLEREGIRTGRFVLRPLELDDSTDTLISIAPLGFAQAVSPRGASDLAALAAWVRRGGRLVYVGRYTGLADAESAQLKLPRQLPGVGASGQLHGPLTASTGPLASVGTDRMLTLPPEHVREEIADRNGDIVVRYPLGRGEVIAVTGAAPFANRALGQAGNARLAYLLGVPHKAGGRVDFDDGVHGMLADRPWYRAMTAWELLALAIMAIAIVLWVVGGMLPAIPAFRLGAKREPTSAEFIAALAALYERTGARAQSGQTLTDDALRTVARAVGVSDRATPADIAARAAPRPGGANVAQLVAALDTPLLTDEDLLAKAKLTHTIRKDFMYGSNGDGRSTAFTGRSRTRRRR